ncbi:hypothetical protein H8L32_12765 [Undibacterium sp. CY18W]|uniref:Uncharacterized protein n=1 Tax=Undibacterium hunanense TaxID=2762292 RepID=A0ABR6ZR55_9BURK|nr:hypothetical protein [Undibacterium hunanense]MBC3918356.1 hypothetical protein [Undibacterium hunanense]
MFDVTSLTDVDAHGLPPSNLLDGLGGLDVVPLCRTIFRRIASAIFPS